MKKILSIVLVFLQLSLLILTPLQAKPKCFNVNGRLGIKVTYSKQ